MTLRIAVRRGVSKSVLLIACGHELSPELVVGPHGAPSLEVGKQILHRVGSPR